MLEVLQILLHKVYKWMRPQPALPYNQKRHSPKTLSKKRPPNFNQYCYFFCCNNIS